MDCAGKRCLRSRVCPGIPLVISASAGQGVAIIPGQVRCTPEFVKSSAEILPGIKLIVTSSPYMGYFSKYPKVEIVQM